MAVIISPTIVKMAKLRVRYVADDIDNFEFGQVHRPSCSVQGQGGPISDGIWSTRFNHPMAMGGLFNGTKGEGMKIY
jgi:hypothetical protein